MLRFRSKSPGKRFSFGSTILVRSNSKMAGIISTFFLIMVFNPSSRAEVFEVKTVAAAVDKLKTGSKRLPVTSLPTKQSERAKDLDNNSMDENQSSLSIRETATDNTLEATLDEANNLVIEAGFQRDNSNSLQKVAVKSSISDTLKISFDGSDFTITESHNTLGVSGVASARGDGTSSLTIPLKSVSGEKIFINTLGGDDELTIDFGDNTNPFPKEIIYNGGSTVETTGDVLNLISTVTINTADFTFDNEKDGSILISGNRKITYIGLEPIIAGTFDDVILNYSTAGETITVSDPVGFSLQINSTVGELVKFDSLPTNSLTINAGNTGANTINLNNLVDPFSATLDINGGDGGDTVNINGIISFAAGKSLMVDAATINMPNNTSDVATSGAGTVGLTATKNILMSTGSSLSTVNGGITLNANQDATADVGDFSGISLDGATIQSTGSGAITLNGRGGESASNVVSRGVLLTNASMVNSSSSGNVTISGTGGAGAGNTHHGVLIKFGSDISVNSGNMNVTGTGSGGNANGFSLGTMTAGDFGRLLSSTGDITVTGTASGTFEDISSFNGDNRIGSGSATGSIGLIADKMRLTGGLVQSTGSLTIRPLSASTTIGLGSGAGTLNLTDTELGNLADGFSSITIGDATSGDIDINTATFDDPVTFITGGEIHDNVGTDITLGGSDAATMDGTAAPGQSPGILEVTGNFAFAANSSYEVEIGGTTAGVGNGFHDQIDATGSVTIGAMVALNPSAFLNGGGAVNYEPSGGESFEIINRTGGTGTFDGLGEGATVDANFLGSGLTATITYEGGDGDDVVIEVQVPTTTTVSKDGNDLKVEDTDGSTEDMLKISTDGSNIIINDPSNLIAVGTGLPNATGNGTNTVTVPLTDFSGGIIVNTLGQDDKLTVDFGGGANFSRTIRFNGGETSESGGDKLALTGGATFADATYNFNNVVGGDADNGTIDITSNSTITFTGLEPVTSSITNTNITLNYSTTGETIAVSNAGSNQTTVTSTIAEMVTFNDPTGTLQINGGDTGVNTFNVGALANNYPATIDINGGDGGDTANLNGTITFAAGKSLMVDGKIVNMPLAGSDIIASGTGSVTLNAMRNIVLSTGASITTVNGGIGLTGSGAIAESYIGVTITGAIVETTGSGGITINATASGSGDQDGFRTQNGAIVRTANGNIDITGTSAGSGEGLQFGQAGTGNIVESTGSGEIRLNGFGNNAFAPNEGTIGNASGTGDIIVTSNFVNFGTDFVGFKGLGALVFKPATANTSIGVGGGAGTINISDGIISRIFDGFSSITIGDATSGTGAVDVNSSTFNDTLTIVGGSIAVTELNAGTNGVILTARTGAITDGGDAGTDVTASSLSATAATGVGSPFGDEIVTAVSSLEADGGSGGVYIANTGDLTIGGVNGLTGVSSSGGTINVTTGSSLSVTEAIAGAADILLAATGVSNADVTVSANITKSAGSDATLTIQAHDDIFFNSSADVTSTFNKLNVILNSDRDASGFGGISLGASTVITSNNGDITLGGGADPAAANARGNFSTLHKGVYLNSATLTSGTGAISVRGMAEADAINTANTRDGVNLSSSTIESTSGNITVTGSGNSTDKNPTSQGVNSIHSTISTAGGTVNVTGIAGFSSGSDFGVILQGSSSFKATGSGNVNVTGTGGGGADAFDTGIFVGSPATILVNSGVMMIDGNATSGVNSGVIASGGQIGATGSGSVQITGTGFGGGPGIQMELGGTLGGSSDTGPLKLITDTIALLDGTVRSTNTLTIEPKTASTTIGLGSGTGTLNIDDSEIGKFFDGFSSITIGDATAGDIDINTVTFSDPVTFMTGGEIHDNTGTDITMGGSDTASMDGIAAPGQSPGILNVTGNFAFADNSTFEVEIGGTSPGVGAGFHDQIDATGSVTIGAMVTLTESSFSGFNPSAGNSFEIINRTGGTGTFKDLAEGGIVSANFLGSGLTATITYEGDDGDDVVIEVAAPSADLEILKTASALVFSPGDTVTYTVKVTNNGPGAATGVVVPDTLPDGVTFANSSATAGSYNNMTGLWNGFGLANSAMATLTIKATADPFTAGQPAGTGAFIDVFASAGLDLPVGLGFGPDGNLYVNSRDTDEVRRYNGTTGAFIDVFVVANSGGLDEPLHSVFGPDGNLYVSSLVNDNVLRYNGTTGAFIDVFANGGGLDDPDGLAFGPDGNLYVSSSNNDQVRRYNGSTGVFIDAFVTTGLGGLDLPTELRFGPDGNLYVNSRRTHEVLRYNGTTGAFIDEFVTANSGGLSKPRGLMFGPDGNLYVGSSDTDNVLRYNGTTGAFIDVFATGGGLDKPRGVVFGPDGNLYVSSALSDKVLRYDGFITNMATVSANEGDINPTNDESSAGIIVLDNQCTLTAATDTNQVGTEHTVTVTVKQNDVVQQGVAVTFDVFKGPNMGVSGTSSSPTNASGQATFTYTSNGTVGTDSIKVNGTIDGFPFECFAEKVWVNNQCTLAAATDTNVVGTEHTVTVTVKQNNVVQQDVTVTFDVFKGPNIGVSGASSSPTDVNGEATFTYTSNGTAGTDSIKASGTINGVPFECFAEKVWQPNADLEIIKTASALVFSPGDTVTYTVKVTNNGPSAATGVVVPDTLPDGVTFANSSATDGSYSSATGLWDGFGLANSAMATLTIKATADPFTVGQPTGTGAFIDVFSSGGGLDRPNGVVFGPDGNLYVSSFSGDNVLRYNGATGAFIDEFASGSGLNGPIDLVFGPDGNLYVSSIISDNVLRYNGTTGIFIDGFTSGGGLDKPAGLAFGPDGNLYVSSEETDQVLRYNGTTGAFIDGFASGSGLDRPRGLVFGPDGNLYISSLATNEVLRYNGTTGAFIDVFASTGLNLPIGLVFGPDGNLYVCSSNNNNVLRYNGTTGASMGAFPGGGGLSKPTYLVFGPDGNLYVSSDNTDNVLRYDGFTTNTAFVSANEDDINPTNDESSAGIVVFDNQCTLAAATDTNIVSTQHTVTVTVKQNNVVQQGVAVTFDVFKGPNMGVSGTSSSPTDVNGEATFTYTSNGTAGTDSIKASGTISGVPFECFAEKVWLPNADLEILKTASAFVFSPGDTVTYTVKVTNNGPSAATGVVVPDTLPDGVTFANSSATAGSYNNMTGLWNGFGLANSAMATLTIKATADAFTVGQPTGTGAFIDVFASGGGLDRSDGLVFGPDGNLYVSSFITDEVLRYNGMTGAFIDVFVSAASGGLDEPVGLTFGPDGNLYVCSFTPDKVLRYNGTTGAFIDAFVSAGSGGLGAPFGLVFGPDGNLYVSSRDGHNVLRYNGKTGAFIDEFFIAASGGLNAPRGLVFGPEGNLYVSSDLTDQILRYNGTTGAFIDAFVVAASGGLDRPLGLTFGPDGNLYVNSFANHRVLRYNGTTGVFIDAFVSASSGGLSAPFYSVFGPDGHLYVSSDGTDQVLRYDGFITNTAFVSANEDDINPTNDESSAGIIVLDNQCTLEAATDTNMVSTQHTVTVTVKQNNVVQQGVAVTFDVFKGPNMGVSGTSSSPTDVSGQATFTYTGGNTAGTDSIKASGTIDGIPFECFAEKVWVDNQCTLAAATDTNQVNTEHTVTVTVKQGGVVQQGVAVTFDVFKGPNMGVSGTSSGPTDVNGQATFTYLGDGGVGVDSIKASGTINGVPFECFAEKVWLPNADLEILKTASALVFSPGDTVTYTVKVTNNGPSAATGVVVPDTLPDGVTFANSSATAGSYNNMTGLWNGFGLANSAMATLTIKATADAFTVGQPTGTGAFIDVFASGSGLDAPRELLFGPDGNLYVTSRDNHQVLRYNGTTGAFIDVFAFGGGLQNPQGLVFGPDGNLYVSSATGNNVFRYNGTTGAFIDMFVTAGSGGLLQPQSLLFGPDGNLYVSSVGTHEVLRYNGTTGAVIDTFVSASLGGLNKPRGLVFGPDDNLYVSSQFTDEVLRYNGSSGAFIDVFASGSGLDAPLGLVFGPDGNLYVADFDIDKVLRYNGTTGAFIDTFVTAGSGGLDRPAGLVFGPDGNLYVNSFETDQVLRYDGFITNTAFVSANEDDINPTNDESSAGIIVLDSQCTLAAATDTNQVDTQHTVTVTVKQNNVVQQGVAVMFDVFKGPNMNVVGVSSSPTDASGQATFTYTGSSMTGTDSIKASGSINGVPFECFAEKVWVDNQCTLAAATDTNQVNTEHTVTVTVKQGGVVQQGVAVTFDVFKGPNMGVSGTSSSPTDASGQATFTYTGGNTAGTDSIKASGSINGVPFECFAEKVWVDNQCLLAAATDTNQVNTEHTVTVTVKQGGAVQQGVAVTFDVFKGPNMSTAGTSSSPTDVNGQATFTYLGDGGVGVDSIKASGTINGVPFECLAEKIWVDNQCMLAAATDTNQVNTEHTVTVTVKQGGVVQQGVTVTFDVFKGPNIGVSGTSSSPTDASGQATFTYTGGSTTGTDSIKASGTINGVPFECFAEKVWVDNQCMLAAVTDTNQVNTEHTVTVTVKQNNVVQQGVAITFDVFKGPNMGVSGTSSSPTDVNGQATFTYTGGNTAGTDSIKASGTINGVPFECFAEKVWVDNQCTLAAATDTNQVNTEHTVTVTVKQGGVVQQGVAVTFDVFKGPNMGVSGTSSSPTDASGQATFTYTGGSTAGTDSIKASGTINGVPFECFAEKVWVDNQCMLAAATDTNQVNTEHTVTVTVKKNNVVQQGFAVTFDVFKGPNMGVSGTSSSPTDASGQATFTYTGGNTAGTDSIKASGTINGVPFECFAEKVWVDNMCVLTPPTDRNQVSTQHTVTATITQNGTPVQGALVLFSIFKGPNAALFLPPIPPTDVNGQTSLTYTSNGTAGTDSIKASGVVNGVPFECFAEKQWVEAVIVNPQITAETQLVFWNSFTNQFEFELKLINSSQTETLFSPLFVEIATLDTDPPGQNPPVTVFNPDRGGNSVGAVFDYSDSLGGDGMLLPGEMTTFKLWVFADPGAYNFQFFANVFGFLGNGSSFAKSNSGAAGAIRFYADVKNKRIEIGSVTTDVEDLLPTELPTEFTLHQNYPNPFNPETTIRFGLPQASDVTINIYNLHGQLIRRLVVDERQAGFHEIVWDARDESGTSMPSGVYLYRIKAGSFMEVRKLMLLR